MNGLRRIRPRPATAIAALALVAALAGTAVAGPTATTSITAKRIKKISTKQIKKLAPTLSVANATNATNATNASTVGGQTAGQLQSIGRSAPNGSCDPPSPFQPVNCATVNLNLPNAARVLLVGDVTWYSEVSPTRGLCRLIVDNSVNTVGPDAILGELLDVTDVDHMIGTGLNGVTGVLGAGSHTFKLQCAQGQGDLIIDAAYLSAVSLGST